MLGKHGLMRKVEIAPLELSYLEAVVQIEKECFSVPWSLVNFEESIKNPMNYFVCAKLNNQILGYAGMYAIEDEGYVYNIAVTKLFRGQGIAKAMIDNLIHHSKVLNLKFLSLEVRQSNGAAIHLYEKYGFESCGVRKNFYTYPTENALIMTLPFLEK